MSNNYLEEISSLPNESFGIPDKRKYPIHNETYLNMAIKLFNEVDEIDESTLANNIINAINISEIELLEIDEYNRLIKYLDEDNIAQGEPKSFINNKTKVAKNQKAHLYYVKKKMYNRTNNATDQKELPKYNQIGEDAIFPYRDRYKKYLTFPKIVLCKSNIRLWKHQPGCEWLSNIKENQKGFLYVSGVKEFVAAIVTEEKDDGSKWITIIDINPKYRNCELYKQLIEVAVNELGAMCVSVNINNSCYIELYKNNGFEFYKYNGNTAYLKYKKIRNED